MKGTFIMDVILRARRFRIVQLSFASIGLVAAIVAAVGYLRWMFLGWNHDFPLGLHVFLPCAISVIGGSMGYPHPVGKAALVIGAPFLGLLVMFAMAYAVFWFFPLRVGE